MKYGAPQSRVRDCVYTEVFEPNGLPLPSSFNVYNRAIAGTTPTGGGGSLHKFIEQLGGSQIGLYDLSTGDAEGTNLCANGCDATAKAIISELKACRDQFNETCTLQQLNDPCNFDSDCCPGLICFSLSCTEAI